MNSVESLHCALYAHNAALPYSELLASAARLDAAASYIESEDGRLAEARNYLGAAREYIVAAQAAIATVVQHTADYIADTGGALRGAEQGGEDEMFERQRKKAERQVDEIVDTFRGVRYVAREVQNEFGLDLRELISGKVVCDMGSGLGGFAKTVAAEDISATVYSLNPHLADPEAKLDEEVHGRAVLQEYYPDFTEADLARIQRIHDERAVARYAHDTGFESGSVDVIIDCVAVHTYMDEDAAAVNLATLREYRRILRPGGIAIVLDTLYEINRTRGGSGSFKQQAAQRAGLQCRPIRAHNFNNHVVGALLWKPAQ